MENFEEVLTIDPKASVRKFRKGEVIQQKGTNNPRAFYVKRGLLRSYLIDSQGKSHIFMFAPENWIIADVESLEFDQPAELFIDCVEDSEVLVFNRDGLWQGEVSKELVAKNFKLLYRRMGMLQRRIIMQMSAPAVDRYEYFVTTYPQLPNRVPQHMIASYLGITPQALSALRSKLARG